MREAGGRGGVGPAGLCPPRRWVTGCGLGGRPEEPSRGLPRGAKGLVGVRARYASVGP